MKTKMNMKNPEPSGSKLSQLSTEELIIQQKKRFTLLVFFSILFGIMILTSLYGVITKKVSAATFIPISFLPIYMIFWKGQKDLRNEIKSRKSN